MVIQFGGIIRHVNLANPECIGIDIFTSDYELDMRAVEAVASRIEVFAGRLVMKYPTLHLAGISFKNLCSRTL